MTERIHSPFQPKQSPSWDIGLHTVVSVINDKTVVFDKDITTGTILEVTSLLGHWATNSSQCY